MTFWKFLHILSMFLAVSIFVGQGMLSGAVGRSGDVQALRRVLSLEDRFQPIGGGVFLLGIVFGFITAITGDLDLTQTWLIIAYVLAAVILLNAFLYHIPYARKLEAAIEAGPDDQMSPELRALVEAPSTIWFNVFDSLVWVAIIYVMVVKPFS